MLDDQLSIDVDTRNGHVVVSVQGELDLLAAPALEGALDGLDADLPVLVDCSAVEFMDSTALRVLLSQSMRPEAQGGVLRICNPSKQALHVLLVSGLDHLIAA